MERHVGYFNLHLIKSLFIPEKIFKNILDRFPSDLSHDGTLSSKILVTQTQEVVDDKRCHIHKKRQMVSVKADSTIQKKKQFVFCN